MKALLIGIFSGLTLVIASNSNRILGFWWKRHGVSREAEAAPSITGKRV